MTHWSTFIFILFFIIYLNSFENIIQLPYFLFKILCINGLKLFATKSRVYSVPVSGLESSFWCLYAFQKTTNLFFFKTLTELFKRTNRNRFIRKCFVIEFWYSVLIVRCVFAENREGSIELTRLYIWRQLCCTTDKNNYSLQSLWI